MKNTSDGCGVVKRIVNFSGGLCSFWSAMRVKELFGTECMTLLFADTTIEDPSLYKFNQKAAEIIGVPITTVSDGRSPWQLFRDRKCIGNSLHPICSYYLKREQLDKWRNDNCDPSSTIIYMGYDTSEWNRLDSLRKSQPDWTWEAPLCEQPLWDKCRMRSEADKLGLPKQNLYELGFPHNNCGGACVRAGISHFVHLLSVMPSKFLEWEKEERETITAFKAAGVSTEWSSMLKDRRGGVTNSMTLEQLRGRIEAGESFPKHDWGGCGCGGFVQSELFDTAPHPPKL